MATLPRPSPFTSGISGTLFPVPTELNRLSEVPGTVALLSRAKTETAEV